MTYPPTSGSDPDLLRMQRTSRRPGIQEPPDRCSVRQGLVVSGHLSTGILYQYLMAYDYFTDYTLFDKMKKVIIFYAYSLSSLNGSALLDTSDES